MHFDDPLSIPIACGMKSVPPRAEPGVVDFGTSHGGYLYSCMKPFECERNPPAGSGWPMLALTPRVLMIHYSSFGCRARCARTKCLRIGPPDTRLVVLTSFHRGHRAYVSAPPATPRGGTDSCHCNECDGPAFDHCVMPVKLLSSCTLTCFRLTHFFV